MQINEAYLVSTVRTPVGKANKGALRNARAEDLGALAVTAALDRLNGFDRSLVDDVIMGCAYPEGPQGNNVTRAIVQKAGLPDSVPGITVNRFCSSGLQTIAQAHNSIVVGQADCVVAGGVEVMSAVPMGGFYFAPDPELVEEKPSHYTSMGITAENVAERYSVSREDQDAFALRSHQRALDAIENGRFEDEIVPVPVDEVLYDDEAREPKSVQFTHDTDEGPRADTTLDALAKLRPVFKQGGSVTAGNASQMNDGAAAAVLMSNKLMNETGAEPVARLLGFAVAGVDPAIMGIGPVEAVPKVLKQTGLSLDDIGLVELNEAFASQALAVIRELGLDEDKVNVNGGAIALGHPLGCTGVKLMTTLLHELERTGGRYGLQTMCEGGGQANVTILERL